ncbi:hypothetical protein B5E56_01630 [Flavonifractor sp. An112]|uniref:hypothetical protein n=1 Tax=Flavonifractor sp. An112 TaxID=1965544 RepID=UPI000B3AA79E|nr:hypothetical protein [Flavonifractor sp. An112]OUQ61432.1 hypothetical protein B5E56_01630 [Flavonifractor sp. An112]
METIVKTPLTPSDLDAINALAKAQLTEDQIYTFAVRLCDNEVDRDYERFPRASLVELAKLFVGKSGIFDHQWSAQGQTARLYKTEVVEEPGQTTEAGDSACWLKGYAYMVRTEANRDLIAEIEGGIKKEISVGCAVNRSTCSICGSVAGSCGHRRGQVYDGQLCFFNLEEPADAYEWSFVAVPAQRKAGVVKALRQPQESDKAQLIQQARARLELEKARF